MKFMLLSLQLRQVRGGTILQPKAARDCESQGGIACESIRYGCSKRRRSDRASFIGFPRHRELGTTLSEMPSP
jgi:hypothetical protein